MSVNVGKVQYAYVDESGDPYLDLTKDGTSHFYVVCAILVDANQRDLIENKAANLIHNFFGTGEMKSSGVGGDLSRRIRILNAIGSLGVKFTALVADKQEIYKESGLQYRRSCVKYLHDRLYKRLYKSFAKLHVYADQHGRSEFMESFKKYLSDRYQRELFDYHDFSFVDSAKQPLVQIADMIAGSLLRYYSGKDPADVVRLLVDSAIIIERWPPNAKTPDVVVGIEGDEKYDHLVAEQGVRLARQFVKDHEKQDDPDIESQVEALRYLFYTYEQNQNQYAHAEDILRHVNQSREEEMSLQVFRYNIIAKLRNEGVIIASSNKGYKIPSKTKDMNEFVSLVDGMAIPYLKRLAIARDHLLLSSNKEYDIVNKDQYMILAKCLNVIEGEKFDRQNDSRSEETSNEDAMQSNYK